jgi:hypothetical protein
MWKKPLTPTLSPQERGEGARESRQTSASEPHSDHLLEDLPLDVLVGEAFLVPPPAVALHLLGGRDEAVADLGEVGVGVVQGEDQAAGADPAQCQVRRARR